MIARRSTSCPPSSTRFCTTPGFQKLEWRLAGLKFLVDRTNFRENVKVEILNVSKDELLAGLRGRARDREVGPLQARLYSPSTGSSAAQPFGAIIANYDFGPGAQDVKLLQYIAAASRRMAHAPFIAAAGPEFFGVDDFEGLPNLKDLKSIFEGPQYTKWRSLPRDRRTRATSA